jgi:hypothetical protein
MAVASKVGGALGAMLNVRLAGLAFAISIAFAGPAAVQAATREVLVSAGCGGSASWSLRLVPANGRIAVTFSVMTAQAGQAWAVRIKHGTTLAWSGSEVTDSSGDFSVTLDRGDRPGTDTFVGRARNLATNQVCRGTASLEPVYTFRDEFSGTAVGSSWRYWAQSGDLAYSSSQASVAGGELKINAVRSPIGWTSAGLDTCYGRFSQLYGYFEARIRFSAGYGVWPAFWLTQGYTVGHRNELDVMESLANPVYGTRSDTSARYYATIHYDDGSGAPAQQYGGWAYNSKYDLAGSWHVYSMYWRPGRVNFYIDGLRWKTFTDTAHIPSVSMCVIFDLAMGGSWPGPTTPTTPSPSTLEVDWVRVSN